MTTLSLPEQDAAASDVGFDAFLGAAHNRFLGDGHRRVTLELTDLAAVGSTAAESVARVRYPHDWSLKAGGSREAHLSTVDAIRVAAAMRSALAAGPMQWLSEYDYERSLTVRAGAKPFTELDVVPVRTMVERPDLETVRLVHQVGSLRVETDWTRAEAPTLVDSSWQAGNATRVVLADDCSVSCFYERKVTTPAAVSFLEVMLLTAQMSQVALYQGDPIRRAHSGNMWMRRAQFLRNRWTADLSQRVAARLDNQRDLTVGGRRFSTAEVRADDMFGVQVTASLASGS